MTSLSLESSRSRRAFTMSRDLERLAGIARELARKAGREGITVDNVRRAVENRGLILGSSDAAYRSQLLGRVMKQAKLRMVPGVVVRSPKGNWVRRWRAA